MKHRLLILLASVTLLAAPLAPPAQASEPVVIYLGFKEAHTLHGNGCMPTLTHKGSDTMFGTCFATEEKSRRASSKFTSLVAGQHFTFERGTSGPNPCERKGRLVVRDKSSAAQTLTIKCALKKG